jgi:hypothetical protein
VFLYSNIINTVKDNLHDTTEAFKEEQFNVIWSFLNDLQEKAEDKVTKISLNIETKILNLSNEDLEKLHADMESNSFNENLHNILTSNIQNQCLNGINNHRNGIIVTTTKGYIEDFNYRRANIAGNKNASLFREWAYNYENSYNRPLEENAIDKLLNRTSGIIALESYDLINNPNHIKIKELTYKTLLGVFLEEGMEGLRNYQIFVPYYITDLGDIFGTPDIFHGTKVENHKIIVIQEFNLYDQLNNHSVSKIFDEAQIDNLNSRHTEVLNQLYIFGIALVTAVCALIFYFCTVYNSLIAHEESDMLTNNKESVSEDNTEEQNDIKTNDL